ncbi:PAAR domain-containing protein [Paraburkholderia sp. Ac-20342]|uniref:PAAR domain-containing protein n=1 Tax=Paraburkholderia sp. Ac-20342 TaxID=2703889 RepID=UPI00198078B1|nr:PAAR domain-containing protein [Paraburkholderia sp. Ac-20342]
MTEKAIICQGDTTSHGGTVLEGEPTDTVDGKAIAGVGHMVSCPKCGGVFPILPITRRYPHRIHGRETAVEGMRTACGAVLIASQHSATISDEGVESYGSAAAIASATASGASLAPSQTLCLECLKAAAANGSTMVPRE